MYGLFYFRLHKSILGFHYFLQDLASQFHTAGWSVCLLPVTTVPIYSSSHSHIVGLPADGFQNEVLGRRPVIEVDLYLLHLRLALRALLYSGYYQRLAMC